MHPKSGHDRNRRCQSPAIEFMLWIRPRIRCDAAYALSLPNSHGSDMRPGTAAAAGHGRRAPPLAGLRTIGPVAMLRASPRHSHGDPPMSTVTKDLYDIGEAPP